MSYQPLKKKGSKIPYKYTTQRSGMIQAESQMDRMLNRLDGILAEKKGNKKS